MKGEKDMKSEKMMRVNQNTDEEIVIGGKSTDYILEYDEHGRIVKYIEKDKSYTEEYVYHEDGSCTCTASNGVVQELNKDGKIVCQKTAGDVEWAEYNEFRKSVHYKLNNTFEEWGEYDENGNLIYLKDTYGKEERWFYNKQGQIKHTWSNDNGSEEWYEYDENGNQIYYSRFTRYECRKEYDSAGNMVHVKNSDGFEEWNRYDEHGNRTYSRDNSGYEQCWSYNGNHQVIEHKNNIGLCYVADYNDEGKITCQQYSEYDLYYTYDEAGNLIRCERVE